MRIVLKPRLTSPLTQTTQQYIEFWGAELYNDFCSAFGLTPMGYWEWEAATRQRGIDWWHKCLDLSMIQKLPPLADYCMLVRASHPEETAGPTRYFYYAEKRKALNNMTSKQVHEMLWHEMGGQHDETWYNGAAAHLGGIKQRVSCCPWIGC